MFSLQYFGRAPFRDIVFEYNSGKLEKDRITVPLGNRGASTGDMKQIFFCFQNVCTVICIQIVNLIIVIIWPKNAVTHVNNENVCSAVE